MKKRFSILLILLTCLSLPISAIRKETKLILDRLLIVEKSVAALTKNISILANSLSTISDELNFIRNNIRTINRNQADQNQYREKQAGDFSMFRSELGEIKNSLDNLTQAIQSALAENSSGWEDTPVGGTSNYESAKGIWNMAYLDYSKGNFDIASSGFEQFLKLFPDHPSADNALYWIGECHLGLKQLEPAVRTFARLIKEYPDSDKVQSAYLKEGFILIDRGKQSEGIRKLRELITKYPISEEAELARQKLQTIDN